MTTAIAWGTPYYVGGQPGTSPFSPGNEGSVSFISFIQETFRIGLVGGVSDWVVTVEHSYTPAGGGDAVLIGAFDLGVGTVNGSNYGVNVPSGYRDGIHKFTAVENGVTLPTVLLLAVTPHADPAREYYGGAAWYEQIIEPVTQFWTRFVNTREVI